MTLFDKLVANIAAEPKLDQRTAALVEGIADCLKATSNDQNVQRLARDLRAAAPQLARAVATADVDA